MPIVNIKRGWKNEDAGASLDENLANPRRDGRVFWTALVDDPTTETAVSVQNLAAAAGYGAGMKHPDDTFQRCTSFRVSRLQPLLFLMEGQFTARGKEAGDNPLDEPPQIEMDFATESAEFDQDLNGDPIETINGEGYTVTDEISDLVLVVTRNLPAWDYLLAWQYMNRGAVSSDEVLGFPPGVARIRGLRASSVDAGDFIYFRAQATVQFRAPAPDSLPARAWYARRIHEGFKIRDNANDPENLWHPADDEGVLVTRPVRLKADGTRKQKADPADWQEWKIAPVLPFSALGIF